jgi:hypothetical protein
MRSCKPLKSHTSVSCTIGEKGVGPILGSTPRIFPGVETYGSVVVSYGPTCHDATNDLGSAPERRSPPGDTAPSLSSESAQCGLDCMDNLKRCKTQDALLRHRVPATSARSIANSETRF